jgi:hypothetical protein
MSRYMGKRDAALYHFKSREDSKIISIDAALLGQSDKAYLIDTGDTDKKGKPIGKWVPKSLSEYDATDKTLQVEEWFAVKEGLV